MTKQRFAFICHNQRKKACEGRMPIQKLIAEAESRYENKKSLSNKKKFAIKQNAVEVCRSFLQVRIGIRNYQLSNMDH